MKKEIKRFVRFLPPAPDVIDTIRQLNRQRIEANGDLMRGGKK